MTIFIPDGINSIEYLFLNEELLWTVYTKLSKGTNNYMLYVFLQFTLT